MVADRLQVMCFAGSPEILTVHDAPRGNPMDYQVPPGNFGFKTFGTRGAVSIPVFVDVMHSDLALVTAVESRFVLPIEIGTNDLLDGGLRFNHVRGFGPLPCTSYNVTLAIGIMGPVANRLHSSGIPAGSFDGVTGHETSD
jgi:hypothetical protein